MFLRNLWSSLKKGFQKRKITKYSFEYGHYKLQSSRKTKEVDSNKPFDIRKQFSSLQSSATAPTKIKFSKESIPYESSNKGPRFVMFSNAFRFEIKIVMNNLGCFIFSINFEMDFINYDIFNGSLKFFIKGTIKFLSNALD